MSRSSSDPPGPPPADDPLGDEPGESLLDLVDTLLNRGVLTEGDVMLGLAGIDLVYLRLSALLCATDRVVPPGGVATGGPPTPERDAARPGRVPPSSTPVASAASAPAVPAPPGSTPPPPESTPAATPAGSGAGREPGAGDGGGVQALATEQLEALRGELEERLGEGSPARWNADPENAQRAVAKLVLTLVDFLRQLMERQAIRRMEAGTLTADEVERLGVALMRLEETLHEMAARFGIRPEELNLELGPLGRLT